LLSEQLLVWALVWLRGTEPLKLLHHGKLAVRGRVKYGWADVFSGLNVYSWTSWRDAMEGRHGGTAGRESMVEHQGGTSGWDVIVIVLCLTIEVSASAPS